MGMLAGRANQAGFLASLVPPYGSPIRDGTARQGKAGKVGCSTCGPLLEMLVTRNASRRMATPERLWNLEHTNAHGKMREPRPGEADQPIDRLRSSMTSRKE